MYRQLQIKISFPHARSWASFPTIQCGSRLIARNVCLALRTWGRSTDLVTNLLSRTNSSELRYPRVGESQSRFRRGAADEPAFRNGPPHLSHTPARRRPQTLVGPAAPPSPFSQYCLSCPCTPCTSIPAPVISNATHTVGRRYGETFHLKSFFPSPFHLQFTFLMDDMIFSKMHV